MTITHVRTAEEAGGSNTTDNLMNDQTTIHTIPSLSELRAEILRLDKAATSGPWSNRAIGYEVSAPTGTVCQMMTMTSQERDFDAAFISFARAALPALLAIADRLEADIQEWHDKFDLMCDEFARIKAAAGNHEFGRYGDEVIGLCDRAISDIKQHVPVIEQRNIAQRELSRLQAENEKLLRRIAAIEKPSGEVEQ